MELDRRKPKKVCTICEVEKITDDFGIIRRKDNNGNTIIYSQSSCKKCHGLYPKKGEYEEVDRRKETKVCNECKTEKNFKDFADVRKFLKGGIVGVYSHYLCRKCENKKVAKRQYADLYKRTIMNINSNSRKRGSDERITRKDFIEHVGEPQKCYICGYGFEMSSSYPSFLRTDDDLKPEVDHIIPVTREGKTVGENLAWAHKACNRIKRALLINELIEFSEIVTKIHKTT